MIVFTSQLSARLQYVLDFIFYQNTQTPYTIAKSKEEFAECEDVKINYSESGICDKETHIRPCGFLFEKTLQPFSPEVDSTGETPVLFSTGRSGKSYPFDIFSAIFYLISRYEEYGSKAKDKWNRYPAKESLSYKHNFLHLPVVDIWLHSFFQHLATSNSSSARHFPLSVAQRETIVRFTYDIDVAYAYKGRHIVRQGGSAFKDILRINPYNLAQRTAVLAGYLEDPFDTYDYIIRESIKPMFFFLLSEKKTKYDHNISPENRILKKLAIYLHRKALIGIHPSFYSTEKPGKITTEKRTLEAFTGQPVVRSRQHYLKFRIPDLYRHLHHAGITEDYSMAYPETPGFRAGTCTPFYFFDVEKDVATRLQIFPSPIMESTFRDDMVMPVQEALPYFIKYFDEVNKVNGHFIPIFHNDTLAANNRQHFRWLHQQILQYIRSRI